jgi:hypothetical protein
MRSPSTGHKRAPSPHRPWRRRAARGAWLRSGDVAFVPRLLALLPSLPRAELARLTERMIDRMDELDGDPDLELEHEGDDSHDDGCGPIYIHGRRVWGSDEDDRGVITPRYGVDQSAGPINKA